MPICGYCGQQIIMNPAQTGFQSAPLCNNTACPINEKCPKCHSNSLAIIYVPGKEIMFECRDCGEEWKRPL